MQHFKQYYALVLLIFIFSCSDNSKTDEEAANEDIVEKNGAIIESQTISMQLPICEKDTLACTQVTLNYPEFRSDVGKIVANKINKDITKLLLKSSINQEGNHTSLEEACQAFLSDYKSFKEKVPSEVPGWEISINIDIINNDNDHLSLMVSDYAYMGGAHPNQSNHFLNYDVNTGKELSLSSLGKDLGVLTKLAEEKFRELKGLDTSTDLAEAGYLFEDGKFQLPENFGLQNGQLLLYYNNYDIASYAEGRTIIKIPLNQIM